MNKLITNTLIAPTSSATGTIGTVVEHEVIFLGFQPISIGANPGHPMVLKSCRPTLLILVGCTTLQFRIIWTLVLKGLTFCTIALEIDTFTRAIQPVLAPAATMVCSTTSSVLPILVIWIIQSGINCS